MNFIYFITPVFLSFFPILFLASSNLGERITLGQIMGTILISGLSSILTIYIFSKILRDLSKSTILICWLIILFFSYGYVISFLSEITILEEPIGRHRYLGTLLLVLTLIFSFKIFHSKKNFDNLIKSIFVASLVLISFNTIQIFIYYSQPRTEILEALNLKELKTDYSNEEKPDVYHIILDMYPSQKILETRFNFDNSFFFENTEKLGFNHLNGRSNYIRTKHSIPSTINFVQLNKLNQDQLLSVQETEWSFQSSLEGFYAKKLGYKIHHLSTNDPQSIMGWMFGDFTRLIVKTSFLRIVEDSPIPINKLWIAKDSKFFKENITKLLDISNDNEPTWTFFYSRPPHPPFIFNQDGTLRDKKEYDQDFAINLTDTWSENTKEMYINQIQYINTQFLKIFDEIIKSSNIKPIIIVHSDHGIHNFSGKIGEEKLNDTSEAVLDEHFNILTSLYTLDNCRKISDKNITNVNIIRTVLRECFKFDIKNTTDNSYWSHRHKNEFISVKE